MLKKDVLAMKPNKTNNIKILWCQWKQGSKQQKEKWMLLIVISAEQQNSLQQSDNKCRALR